MLRRPIESTALTRQVKSRWFPRSPVRRSFHEHRKKSEFLRGNKGALRIPFLSFQLLRRPGCTAKLLCFHTDGGFAPHRPCHLLSFFSIRCQDFQGALRGAKQRLAAWATLPVHDSFRVADNSGATDTSHAKRCSQRLKARTVLQLSKQRISTK